MDQYQGQLELTWTNKHLRLLAHEDGSYEWVEPSDYRVAEVRLFHEVAVVGEVGDRRAADNLLIRGDALNALTSLARLPEFASEYLGKVKLAYLDPPFNTQQSWLHYDDALEHSVWLTMMRDRLLQIKELLSSEGTAWVHCDDSEQHRLRCVMDEVFGPPNYVGTIVWRSSDNSNNDAKQFSTDHNYLLVYSKEKDWVSERLDPTLDQTAHFSNPDNDPRGPWFDGNPLNSPNPRENLRYVLVSPTGYSIRPPANGWRWSRETLDAKIKEGEIRFTPDGKGIRRRTYLTDHKGLPASSLWVDLEETGHNRQAKSELKRLFPGVTTSDLFDTPKPERLIKKILAVASRPDDIILDCFLGSGTTAAVAHKMGRRWIGIEREPATIETYALPRLRKLVAGQDSGGITTVETRTGEDLPEGVDPGESRKAAKVLDAWSKAGALFELGGLGLASMDDVTVRELVKFLRAADKLKTETIWSGGGGFRELEVSPSMFEVDEGLVFLASGMTNGALAEATAAQLGFEYETDPPFAGRKGRARLAVIDGVVNEMVVRLLVSALSEGERVVICGTGIDTEARQILRELRPGSTLRKIPAALLSEYRAARQLRLPYSEPTSESSSQGEASELEASV
jgi:adenine-specific DNA-methyltransferase